MNGPPGNGSAASGAVVVDKMYDLVLWLIQKVEKLPNRMFTWADPKPRLNSAALFRDREPGCGVRADQPHLSSHVSMHHPRRFA